MYDISKVSEIKEQIYTDSVVILHVDSDVFQIVETNLLHYILNNHEQNIYLCLFEQLRNELKNV